MTGPTAVYPDSRTILSIRVPSAETDAMARRMGVDNAVGCAGHR